MNLLKIAPFLEILKCHLIYLQCRIDERFAVDEKDGHAAREFNHSQKLSPLSSNWMIWPDLYPVDWKGEEMSEKIQQSESWNRSYWMEITGRKKGFAVDIFRPSPFVWRGQEGVNHACGPVRHIDSISSRRERPAYRPNAERLFFYFPQLSTDVFYYTRMERLIENASLIHYIPQQQQLCSF